MSFDLVIEVALFAMSIYLVLGLRTALKLKATVVLAFSFRLPYVSLNKSTAIVQVKKVF